MLIDKIQRYLDLLAPSENVNENGDCTLLRTQSFFESLHLTQYSKEQIMYIEIFAKKIEVSKKIFIAYDIQSFSPRDETQINNTVFCRMFCHLMGVYVYTKDYKFLNTLLKMSSNILTTSWYTPLSLKLIFEELIEDE